MSTFKKLKLHHGTIEDVLVAYLYSIKAIPERMNVTSVDLGLRPDKNKMVTLELTIGE